MILLGSSDMGVLQYLSRLKNITCFKKSWITQKKYLSFLKLKKLFQRIKNYLLINLYNLIYDYLIKKKMDKNYELFTNKKIIETIDRIEKHAQN